MVLTYSPKAYLNFVYIFYPDEWTALMAHAIDIIPEGRVSMTQGPPFEIDGYLVEDPWDL